MATRPIGMVINARNDWHMASATLFGEVWRADRLYGKPSCRLTCCPLAIMTHQEGEWTPCGVVNFVVSPTRKASVECDVPSMRHCFPV
jgi:hypothetical protein